MPNRSTNPHALYPKDKGTLALYPGYAAIVDWACSPFNKEIAEESYSISRQSHLPRWSIKPPIGKACNSATMRTFTVQNDAVLELTNFPRRTSLCLQRRYPRY